MTAIASRVLSTPVARFWAASAVPIVLLALAAILGGWFSLAAFLWITGVVFAMDEAEVIPRGIMGGADDPRLTLWLPVALGIAHFLMIPLVLWSLTAPVPGLWDWFVTFLAFGLWFGQVSNANAHELIHRSDRRLFQLGMWVYTSLLFGHHTSAHRKVHHRFVATTDDPNTAQWGESFYAFAVRAWPGAFRAGYEIERFLMRPRLGRKAGRINPYAVYIGGALAVLVVIGAIFGLAGILVWIALSAHAQSQILLSDYVQHYGLLRKTGPDGRAEPVGPQHSWDAPQGFSGLSLLNANRHANHHMRPGLSFAELELSPGDKAPLLPHSLPVMATVALFPRLWRRIMDRRLPLEDSRAL
ncbi:alkane 1-monooxygenase [Defluviimonas sp. WL0002]|uniref:Alkane 1-monooxygenase n=1 Tax=Albidovulum marisflavi TaxID=2984159 RepID=A0ABT2ZAI0_9RHOB|nr:alkane 1-monooxygenase [Defluviimonas sp. WL0002]MCV2868129.1 alkane 1-monooxygenase [Defluviimonas sp. WL0002]